MEPDFAAEGRWTMVSDRRAPDTSQMNELIAEYEPFIRRTASFALRRIVGRQDDAYAVALAAFWDAANTYTPEKGASFKTYAKTVITNRLYDEVRRKKKYAPEILTSPAAFAGEAEEGELPIQREIQRAEQMVQVTPLADEIAELKEELARFDISFEELPDAAPKAEKTRVECARIVTWLCRNPLALQVLEQKKKLPISALETGVPCDRKTVDRYRKYIIAATLIRRGQYPGMQQYLHGRGWDA